MQKSYIALELLDKNF